mgnify:CR=1 FL=1
MPKKIDLTGQRFGRLVVVRESNTRKNRAVMWECICDCGNELIVRGDSLRSGNTKSCGCVRQEKFSAHVEELKNKTHLIGKRFGKLIVLSEHGITNNNKRLWRCECDCGNIVIVSTNSLTTGNTKSCGCLLKEKASIQGKTKIKNLIGQRFERLIVMEDTGERQDSNVIWKCKCDCGNYTTARTFELINGSKKSCGCYRKDFNNIAIAIQHNIEHELKENTELSQLTSKLSKANTSGVKGVSWYEKIKKYKADIQFKGKKIHLGYFDKLEDAAQARKEAEEKYFKPILEKYGRRLNGKEKNS